MLIRKDLITNYFGLIIGFAGLMMILTAYFSNEKKIISIQEQQVEPELKPTPQPTSQILSSNNFCIYCRTQLPIEAFYCIKCGKKVG